MKKQFSIITLMILLTYSLHADIYKWVDNNGTVHFTDKPHPNAEQITLPPTQHFTPPKTTPETTPEAPKETTQEHQAYTTIMIVQPQDQATIRSNQGLLSVITRIEPELNKGDMLQLLYDGAPVGPPQTALAFALNNIFRGTHTLQVQVINDSGAVIGSSASITIYMHHTRVGGGN